MYTTRIWYSEDMRVLSSTNMYSSKQIQISPYCNDWKSYSAQFTTDTDTSASYLDLHLEIDSGVG